MLFAALVLSLGVVLGVLRALRHAREPIRWIPPPVPLPEHHAWHATGAVLGGICGALGATLLWSGALLPQLKARLETPLDQTAEGWLTFAGAVIFQGGAFAGMLLTGRLNGAPALSIFHPLLPRWQARNAWTAASHLLIALPPVTLAYHTWAYGLERFGIEANEQSLVELIRSGSSPALIVALLGMAVCIAPVIEEMLFRGLLYPALRGRLGQLGAAVLTSALFGAIHMNAAGFLPLFLLGLLLCRLVERTGDLRVAMLAHLLFNLNTALQLLLPD